MIHLRSGLKKVNKIASEPSPKTSKRQSCFEYDLDFELDNVCIFDDEMIEDSDEVIQDFY